MMDTLFFAREQALQPSSLIQSLGLVEKSYLVVTFHRAENTEEVSQLEKLLQALLQIREPVVFPMHPRTRKALDQAGLAELVELGTRANLMVIEPLGYMDMVRLVSSSRMVLTDSGGLQKEAYWLGVPCVTLREETEWVETVQVGWNVLVGTNPDKIIAAVNGFTPPNARPSLYGDGHTAQRCLEILQAS
jgi:UDP-N-acetylglucosamine 2-epimerase (non-hydrolysing)/UDP-GlcNAc3NAcA epimerase